MSNMLSTPSHRQIKLSFGGIGLEDEPLSSHRLSHTIGLTLVLPRINAQLEHHNARQPVIFPAGEVNVSFLGAALKMVTIGLFSTASNADNVAGELHCSQHRTR